MAFHKVIIKCKKNNNEIINYAQNINFYDKFKKNYAQLNKSNKNNKNNECMKHEQQKNWNKFEFFKNIIMPTNTWTLKTLNF